MPEHEGNAMEAINQGLPNGFHDAALYEIAIDLQARLVTLTIGADISSYAKRERMPKLRKCRLVISGVEFVQVEPLQSPNWPVGSSYISIDSDSLEGERLHAVYPRPLPTGCWAQWVFMSDTNSFIYLIAREAKFTWLE